MEQRIAKKILINTGYWNGWYISEESRYETCKKIAKAIIKMEKKEKK